MFLGRTLYSHGMTVGCKEMLNFVVVVYLFVVVKYRHSCDMFSNCS